MYINENQNNSHQQTQRARFDIYKKEKIAKYFLNRKSKTIPIFIFIYKKQDTLRYVIFHENVEVGIYIQKE